MYMSKYYRNSMFGKNFPGCSLEVTLEVVLTVQFKGHSGDIQMLAFMYRWMLYTGYRNNPDGNQCCGLCRQVGLYIELAVKVGLTVYSKYETNFQLTHVPGFSLVHTGCGSYFLLEIKLFVINYGS